MDENVRPGDGLIQDNQRQRQCCGRDCKVKFLFYVSAIGLVIGYLLTWPFWIFIFIPIIIGQETMKCLDRFCSNENVGCKGFTIQFLLFLLGLIIGLILSPLFALAQVGLLIYCIN